MKGYIILAILLTFYNYRYDTKVKLLLHCKRQTLLMSHAFKPFMTLRFCIIRLQTCHEIKQKKSETIEI